MSGFRKFRSSTQRRRRWVEAAELGYVPGAPGPSSEEATRAPGSIGSPEMFDAVSAQSDFPASREAVEIGPAPIAWLKPKRETDH